MMERILRQEEWVQYKQQVESVNEQIMEGMEVGKYGSLSLRELCMVPKHIVNCEDINLSVPVTGDHSKRIIIIGG